MNEMKMLEKAVEGIKRIGRVDKCDFCDEVLSCFATEEEVIFNESQNIGYDYAAYVNSAESQQILIKVRETEEEIEVLDAWIA